MSSTITTKNLNRFWTLGKQWGHDIALAPLLAVHAAYRVRRLDGGRSPDFRWEWDDGAAVAEGLTTAWHMSGRWKARRAVSVKRSKFDRRVGVEVPKLAAALNRLDVTCLRDLNDMGVQRYRRAVRAIHEAVRRISCIRKTKQVEPVLGSKVLHHYFPSVVPVFDTALIRNGVLRTQALDSFLESEAAKPATERWLVYDDPHDAGGRAMLEFHRYFALAGAEIGEVRPKALRTIRQRFGRGLSRLAPLAMVNDRHSVLWRMDAKLAEYCLIGEAYRERLIE